MAELIVQNRKQHSAESDAVSQRKSATVLQDNRGQVSQARALTDNRTVQLAQNPSPKPNNTGLPNQLKAGIESLSGISMDHVKVHYNSSQPAQLNAHAYAQGSNIHLAPGQEKHLPHEAWHVVQQAQGRVKPTVQMKQGRSGVAINDESSLESEADCMSEKALQVKVTHSAQQPHYGAGGAIKRVAQLFTVPIYLQNDIKNIKNQTNVKKLGWDSDSIDALVVWSKNEKQFCSTVMNVKRAAWEELRGLGDGTSLNNRVLDSAEKGRNDNTLNALNAAKAIQALPESVHALADILVAKHGKTALPALHKKLTIINNAYGNGSAKEVIAAQKLWQDYLTTLLSPSEIMSAQRSVGYEFEFARYRNSDSDTDSDNTLKEHEILGQSANLTGLFKLPFVLETDSGDELEIGMPPMLIGLNKGGPDKQTASRLWTVLRGLMAKVRQDNLEKVVNTLPLEASGLGIGWSMSADATRVILEDGRPGKAINAKDQVYSQMNISLTPKEIAEFTHGKGRTQYKKYKTNWYEHFAPAYESVHKILEAAEGAQSKLAAIQISKGLSNLLAIPSISMFTEMPGRKTNVDVSSTVKETFGIWVKDSIPNIVDNTLTEGDERREVLELIKTNRVEIEAELEGYLREALAAVDSDLPPNSAKNLESYEQAFKAELKLTLDTLISRLSQGRPSYTKNLGGKFGKESFPTRDSHIKREHHKSKKKIKARGDGVRKETFVNIQRGEGKQEHLHLAEIRNETYMDEYLK